MIHTEGKHLYVEQRQRKTFSIVPHFSPSLPSLPNINGRPEGGQGWVEAGLVMWSYITYQRPDSRVA